jgi:hypothetical protein
MPRHTDRFRRLGYLAVVLYVLSLALPAWYNTVPGFFEIDYKCGALLACFAVLGLVGEPTVPLAVAGALGTLANAAFVLGAAEFLISDRRRRRRSFRPPTWRICLALAAAGIVTSVTSAAALCLIERAEIRPHVGMVLWIASFATLAAACAGMVFADRRETAPGGFPVILREDPSVG